MENPIRDYGCPFPCKDCEKRTLGCHKTCPDYIRVKETREQRKNESIRANLGKKHIRCNFEQHFFQGVIWR